MLLRGRVLRSLESLRVVVVEMGRRMEVLMRLEAGVMNPCNVVK